MIQSESPLAADLTVGRLFVCGIGTAVSSK